MIKRLILAGVLALFPLAALAADLTTTWSPVTVDDAGQPLGTAVEEYRVYDCADLSVPIATVPGTITDYTEPGVITTTGTYCRAVAAYVAPFEGDPAQGTLVVVVPGAPATINVQALP